LLAKLPLRLGWRLMFSIVAGPSLALTMGIFAMLESLRWLVVKAHLGKAKKFLVQVSYSEQEVKLRFKEIKSVAGLACNTGEACSEWFFSSSFEGKPLKDVSREYNESRCNLKCH